ncbi:anthranilate synthase component II [Cyclobacterium jeungdonense]|uniref:Aminodeoxychorismate/anthranilate synthase component II n=1 Tax=Cyclobacterium jeungdonense TaxID=708087 RepID=A0ABT8C417_9BACT|nr:aminodeoxychorismate/anthranilate synthase component II [Cyclobacterium jeungdonense]MDN3687519.1 aminodeoxychorismate/anthranilate synthase component II [Cyclobacterium jeungdonense]
MILLIDNFDSFSYMLADYLRRSGEEVRVVRNDVTLRDLESLDFSAMVLSPGPETPSLAGNLMAITAGYIHRLPILGVCLGHQALGMCFGASLRKSQYPMHGKVSTVFQKNGHPVFEGLPERFEVTRYHSLELKGLPAELEVLLETDRGELMAFCHRSLPLIGLQFHPEAHLTQHGERLLLNWIDLYAKEKREQLLTN